jgi:cellulose synthase operon protein C
MANSRGKLPSDIGNADWDALLSDLEHKVDGAAPEPEAPPPPPARAPEPTNPGPDSGPAKSSRAPGSQPLYRPPQAGAAPPSRPSGPAQQPKPRPREEVVEDLDEERTMVGTISRDLIEAATRGGVGLGQLFDRPSARVVPQEDSAGTMDVSFDDDANSRATPVPASSDDDQGVVTSAPNLDVGRRRADADLEAPPAVLPSGSDDASAGDVPDPFADMRGAPARGARPAPPPLPRGAASAARAAAEPTPDEHEGDAGPPSFDMGDPFAAPRRPGAAAPPQGAPSITNELGVGPKLLEPDAREFDADDPTRIGQVPDQEELRAISERGRAASAPPPTEAPQEPDEAPVSIAPVSATPAATPPPVPAAPAAPPRAGAPAGRPPRPPAAPGKSPARPPPLAGQAKPAGAPVSSGNTEASAAAEPEEIAVPEAPSPTAPPAAPAAKPAPTRPSAARAAPARVAPARAAPKAAPARRASAPALEPLPETPEEQPDASGPAISPIAPDGGWTDERDAVAHLGDMGQLAEWSDRAGWLEIEARAVDDRVERARALIVVSELFAMAGEADRAQSIAEEARELAPNLPLGHRQVRARMAREEAFEALLEPLDAEIRVSPTPASRIHALVLSAEISRLCSHDVELSEMKLAQAIRVSPADPRAHVLKLSRELAASSDAPSYRVSDEPSLEPLASAIAALSAFRGSPALDAPPVSPLDAVTRLRAALLANDLPAALATLASLDGVEGVGPAALWLASSIAAPTRAGRERTLAWLTQLAGGEHPELASRALAARAFELGDADTARAALGAQGVFSAAERAAAGALLGGPADFVTEALASIRGDDDFAPLAAAISSSGVGEPAEAGEDLPRARAALGRALGLGKDAATISSLVERLTVVLPDSALGQALKLEQDVSIGNKVPVALALSMWPRSDSATPSFDRDRALAGSLVYEMAGDTEQAASEAESARQADPTHETPVRVMAALKPGRAATEIDKLAADVEDPVRRALLLLEAASRLGPNADAHPALLRLAHETAPELPFASALGARSARLLDEKETLLSWVRLRREAVDEPAEAAFELVREALLLADDRSLAASLLEEAAKARPDDVALRDLLERFSAEPLADRAQAKAARAEKTTGAARAQLALAAALEFERTREFEPASRYAEMAVQAGGGDLAKLVRDRCDTFGPGAARLSEELMAAVRAAENPSVEREAYERLAYLDEVGRGDVASGLLWHRSILEREPAALPSLRRLEHALVGEGREDELEPIFAEIARATSGFEAQAHAQVASRLRQRGGTWDTTRDLVQVAARLTPPGIWALRQLQAHSLVASDDDGILRATSALADRTDRPAERASLQLRSAEAIARKGDLAAAGDLLKQVLELQPTHPIAHVALAEILEQSGDVRGAAEAREAAAATSVVVGHQVQLWYEAAVLWIDKLSERERGVSALEQAAALDILHGETFPRLQALYTELGAQEKLARLLEQRLEREEDPQQRVALEVTLGRALTDIGDLPAAKRALAAALDGSPDHVDALRAFADLCSAESDWEGAEQAIIRLARLITEPERQAEIYMKLGAIYQEHLPNNERAELAYLEVLKRLPEDVPARERLVSLYAASGEKDKALETQQSLLAAAHEPAEKRQRTIEMARLHETVGGDVKKAEQALDALRKELPHDTQVLRALAEFHTRNNHTAAVNVLLDRAAADARRALTTGRFELHFFANLATVFELRSNADAAHTAGGTVKALDGQPCDVEGIGLQAAKPELDDYIAPDIFTPAFRELLRKAGSSLDAATQVDLKALRATPPPPQAAGLAQQAAELASAFGLAGVQVFVSPAVGPVCMPVSSNPPTLVYGAALVAEPNEAIRNFLTLRALKILQGNVAAFSRTAPIDLWPMTAAFLQVFAPTWNPQGVDANKLRDFKGRIQKHLAQGLGPELGALALEIAGSIGNRASTLQSSANAWGDRCALLATGDATGALEAIAWASGQPAGAPAQSPDRMRWIGRNAEARDVMVWTVSDAYSEARKG